jgi:hypothetical protein
MPSTGQPGASLLYKSPCESMYVIILGFKGTIVVPTLDQNCQETNQD